MPTFSLPTYYLLFLATPRVSKAPYPGHSWFMLYFQFLYRPTLPNHCFKIPLHKQRRGNIVCVCVHVFKYRALCVTRNGLKLKILLPLSLSARIKACTYYHAWLKTKKKFELWSHKMWVQMFS